jgi:outer membrane protein OmpA-like peptidoglycan-associated protein
VVLVSNHGGTAGRISFTDRDTRSVVIDQAGFGVMLDAAVREVFFVDPRKLEADFADAIRALPRLPVSLMLYYRIGGVELTAESAARIEEILREIESRQVPEVSIIGHTDTVGKAENNEALGLRRARRVAATIKAAGLNVNDLAITSHGEHDLLVKTPDNVPEPRNRRVEVTVR